MSPSAALWINFVDVTHRRLFFNLAPLREISYFLCPGRFVVKFLAPIPLANPLQPGHVGTERVRNDHATVFLLIIFQHCD